MRAKRFPPILALLLFLATGSRAQQYLLDRYTPKDGLINNRARFVFQDSKGRLYISTYGGLSVYDGSRFTNYTTENGLTASLVNDVVEMGDDSVWLVPNGSGLHCLVHGVLHNVQTADNFYPVINQLVKCPDGFFYAVADDGLYRFQNNRFARVTLKDNTGKQVSDNLIHVMLSNNRLFILTDPSMKSYPGNASLLVYDLSTRRLLIAARPTLFFSLLRSKDGEVLLATGQGVRMIDSKALEQGEIRLLPLPPPYQAANSLLCKYIYFDNARNLWLSTGKEIIRIDKEGNSSTFNTLNVLPAGIDNSIFQDREGNIWFTYEQNGIAKLVNPQVEFYGQPLANSVISDLSATAFNDSIWFYDGQRHTLLLQNGKTQKIFQGTGIIPPNGRILMGRQAYLLGPDRIYSIKFLDGQRFRVDLLYKDSIRINSTAFFDKDGNPVLVGHRLTVLRGQRIWQIDLPYLSDQAGIDSENRIWTVTRSNVLSVFSNTTPIKLLASWNKDQPVEGARSITADNLGRVWIGTRDHGLYCLFFDHLRLKSWKQLTVKNGLTENFINYLSCDPDNTIWACTSTGLNKVRLDGDHFTVENITPGNDINPGLDRVLRSRNGVHWAMVKDGYMKIKPPEPEKNSYRPHILFSEVLVGGRPVIRPAKDALALTHDRNSLSFFVSAPTFTDETQTRFSYRLQGSSDPQWSSPSTQSSVNFVNLPAGRYTLNVKAQFLTGRFPDETASYPFVINPPWWQTAWFRIAASILFAVLITWITRSYIRRRLEIQRTALERQQAVEKERTRIATDMHDDLGAGLSRIRFLSETIGIKRQKQLPIDEEINGIREYSYEMINKMGEIVWALNERNDSLSDLLSYTRAYASEYLMEAGIHCKVEAPEDFPTQFVSGEFRRNVYLIIKETLHNIVKHARAENVLIRLEIGALLQITIRDDGVGFDRAHIRPFANGLHNMERRAKDIGGILSFLPGPGMTVRLSVPV